MAKKAAALAHDIRVLFRYRDLIANTLEEHRKKIREKGSCWWGWWKRPNEGGRPDVWEFLEQELAAKKEAWVGLFDSGATADATAVRYALVVAMVPPIGPDPREMPRVPDNEVELIPDYYRSSPYSRAWLKITEIEAQPASFFKNYSYDVAPQLPGIPPRYLSRLAGKLVMDHEELRAMDTTIWRVRPKDAHDREEKFLAPGIRITDPISLEPIHVKGDKILHMTDLHFATKQRAQHVWGYPGDGTKKSTMADEVARATKDKGVCLVVITGDFTFITAEDEFGEAYKSVNTLLGSLGLRADNLVIIPGNHDIAWTKPSGDPYDPEKPADNAPDQACEQYKRFYSKLMRHDPDDSFAMGRRFVFPHGGVVEICALNSSSLEQGADHFAGMGKVRPTVFARVCDALGWGDERGSLGLRILAIHHHLTATEDVENSAEYAKGFGMAIDAKKILRDAARRRVHLVLHGHRHRVFVWREGVYELPEYTKPGWKLGSVSILGGGSAGSSSVIDKRNFFNLITVGSGGLIVEIFQSQGGDSFQIMNKLRADFSLQGGHLQLGDWNTPDTATPSPPGGSRGF